MSITKFSKDVLLIGSDFNKFKELDANNRNVGLTAINRVIERLIRLGFRDFKIVGDSSMSIEIAEELRNRGFEPTVFDMYPYTERQLIFNNLLDNSRDELYNNTGSVRINNQEVSHKLAVLETKIAKILGSELSFSNETPDDEKVEIILRVMALTYTRTEFDETTLFDHEDDLLYFTLQMNKPVELIKEVIKSELDYRWKWAREILDTKTRVKYGQQTESEEEPIDIQSMELSEVFSLLDQFATKDKKSEISFGLSDEVHNHIVKPKEEVVNIKSQYTLTEGIKQLSKEEFVKDQLLVEQLDKLLKTIDEYYFTLYEAIVKESNLIVDFFVSAKTPRSKKLPYDKEDNKIILSVDLKNGLVDSFFKGRQFKISSFFSKDEQVQTNALEW